MLPSTFSSLLLTLLPNLASSCAIHARQADGSAPPITIGTDGPADPATIGYAINHIALNVVNFDKMYDFYNNVLGMRHIYTLEPTPDYSIVYLGYSRGGLNGTGFQTGEELFSERANTQSQLELLYFKPKLNETLEPSTIKTSTYSHFGMSVPDLEAAQARLQAAGTRILKTIGVLPQPGDPASDAFGIDNAPQAAAILLGLGSIHYDTNFVLVEDPDGNMVELVRQV